MTEAAKPQPARAAMLRSALLPMLLFAPVNAIVCWTAAWMLRDRYEFMALLVALGGGPILAALATYLYVLVSTVDGNGGR